MTTKVNRSTRSQRSHDRKATLQWLAIGLVFVLGLAAVLLFTEGSGTGLHGG